jgi:hypothetical protein
MLPRTLAEFTGPVRPSGTHLNYQVCPVCGHTGWKVYVNPDTGGWNCNAGQCGARGFLKVGLDPDAPGADILRRLDRKTPEVEWEEVEMPEWEPLSHMALRYLKNRGISEEEAARLGMVEQVDRFRIVVPYFDESGQLVYWNSRLYSDRLGHGPKYLAAPGKHPLYTPLLAREAPSGILAICEGVFDAISIEQAGYRAVALGGKSLPKYLRPQLLRIAENVTILYVALDPDAMADALKLRSQLSDVCDPRIVVLTKDPGDMTPDEIKEKFDEGR